MSQLTNRDFESITCAHCGKPFNTTPKTPAQTAPEDVPWVTGGIISFHEDDGSVQHFHGYFDRPGSCFAKANPEAR